jgi:thioredoxin-related protein
MRKNFLFAVVLIILSLSSFAVPVDQFLIYNDFDKGFQLAQALNKNVIILFSSSNCIYCRQLKEEVLPSDDVSNFIINNYIIIELRADTDKTGNFDVENAAYDSEGKEYTYDELFQLFGIRGVPATSFFNTSQEYLGTLPGFYPKEDYLKWLKFIQQKAYENGDIDSFDISKKPVDEGVNIQVIDSETLNKMQIAFPELLSYWSFEKFRDLNFISIDLNKMYIVRDTDKNTVSSFINGLDKKIIQNIYVVN